MAFPTIPTVAAGRLLWTLNTAGGATKTFPNLSSLTKDAGDLLIAIIVEYDGNSTNAEFSGWGGGFTEFKDQAGTATMAIGLAYKFSDGTETGTFTVTTADTTANDSVLCLLSIPGAHASTPPEAGTMAVGTSAAAAIAALDPAGWAAEDTLWIMVGGCGETSTTGSFTGMSVGDPTNYTGSEVSGITADVVGGVEAKVSFRQLNAASEDPPNFSPDLSNARNSGLIIAIRPSAAVSADAEVSWTELEVPTAQAAAEIAWAEVEVPTAQAQAEVAWAEFEVPTAQAQAEVAWTELEVPNPPGDPADAEISWAELEVPNTPAQAEVAWTEFEVPTAGAQAEVAWAELEVPTAGSQAELSWAEFEVPNAGAQAEISFAAFEVPGVATVTLNAMGWHYVTQTETPITLTLDSWDTVIDQVSSVLCMFTLTPPARDDMEKGIDLNISVTSSSRGLLRSRQVRFTQQDIDSGVYLRTIELEPPIVSLAIEILTVEVTTQLVGPQEPGDMRVDVTVVANSS